MLEQTAIGQLIKNIEQLDESKLFVDVAQLETTREVIAESQREQLQRGERPDGTNYDNYSRSSQDLFGKPDEPIKWFDDGEFYESINTKADENEIKFFDAITTGDNGEEINLELDNNETILGIQDDNFEDIRETFVEGYIEQIRFILGQD
jgi:hypothetical protein